MREAEDDDNFFFYFNRSLAKIFSKIGNEILFYFFSSRQERGENFFFENFGEKYDNLPD